MNNAIRRLFLVSKPADLNDVRMATAHARISDLTLVTITGKKRLSVTEYDELAANFLVSRPWLQDKDGKGRCGSILVTARDRSPLVIQPEGYDYARYVALA